MFELFSLDTLYNRCGDKLTVRRTGGRFTQGYARSHFFCSHGALENEEEKTFAVQNLVEKRSQWHRKKICKSKSLWLPSLSPFWREGLNGSIWMRWPKLLYVVLLANGTVLLTIKCIVRLGQNLQRLRWSWTIWNCSDQTWTSCSSPEPHHTPNPSCQVFGGLTIAHRVHRGSTCVQQYL